MPHVGGGGQSEMETSEHLDVKGCPKCGGSHRFRLAVERSVILKFMTRMDTMDRSRRVRFTRLFTCPTKNEEFEATFVLTETSSDVISGVTAGGVDDDNPA
jgi:hypothetical protein